jgi:hypothetical protein
LGPVATAGYRYRTPAVAAVTAVYRAVTNGKKNPGEDWRRGKHRAVLVATLSLVQVSAVTWSGAPPRPSASA